MQLRSLSVTNVYSIAIHVLDLTLTSGWAHCTFFSRSSIVRLFDCSHYFPAAAALGLTSAGVDVFIDRLDRTLIEYKRQVAAARAQVEVVR